MAPILPHQQDCATKARSEQLEVAPTKIQRVETNNKAAGLYQRASENQKRSVADDSVFAMEEISGLSIPQSPPKGTIIL